MGSMEWLLDFLNLHTIFLVTNTDWLTTVSPKFIPQEGISLHTQLPPPIKISLL